MICPSGCGKLDDCGQTVSRTGVIIHLYYCGTCRSNVEITKFNEQGEPEMAKDE